MKDDKLDFEERLSPDAHMTAASVAAVLSVILHVAAAFYFADFKLNIVVADPERMEEQVYEALKVFEVETAVDRKKRRSVRLVDEVMFEDVRPEELEAADVPVDEAVIEPLSSEEVKLDALLDKTAEPTKAPRREKWQPRQEILAIDRKIARDDPAASPRRLTQRIERVPEAPDYVASVDMKKMGDGDAGGDLGRPTGSAIEQTAKPLRDGSSVKPLDSDKPVEEGMSLFEEQLTEITAVKPIDRYLVANATVYEPVMDFRYGYFKVEVKRAGPEALPVLPKDILLVQDSSASVTEQRLYFCRQGLKQCLDLIGPEDRFNVVSFKDTASVCFPDWQKPTAEARARADEFISGLKSFGNTDIYTSMQELLRIKRDSRRPTVVFVVTDGMANTGLTRSSNIIGEFSKLNKGAISVFMMGTTTSANTYLLDLMGYSNKGGVFAIEGGRWGIPEAMQAGMRAISRPVMKGVQFRFPAGASTEVYPYNPSNLYLDRSMVFYGRYIKKNRENIIFQAVGEAKNSRCDMIFNIALDQAVAKGAKDVRINWAKQKIYHLIGEYTREPAPDLLKAIKTTAKMYRVDIPYEGKF